MGKALYFDCSAGISGDMAVAALLDLKADRLEMERVLSSIPIEGFETRITKVDKRGIEATDFDVILEHPNHDHDMRYLHGDGPFPHEHGHGRGLREIEDIIDRIDTTDEVRALSKRIFRIIAEAEAKVHGEDIYDVHFHEVGSVDSIVDVIAFSVCFVSLGIRDVIIHSLTDGKGTVRCQHGILPIPVPAVREIVSSQSLKLEITDVYGELVTPTGAAIAAAIRTTDSIPPSAILMSGYGAGKREYDTRGTLKVMIVNVRS